MADGDDAVKVLIAGDACGDVTSLMERVSRVQSSKAGPFDLLLVTGSLSRDPLARGGGGGNGDGIADGSSSRLDALSVDPTGDMGGGGGPASDDDEDSSLAGVPPGDAAGITAPARGAAMQLADLCPPGLAVRFILGRNDDPRRLLPHWDGLGPVRVSSSPDVVFLGRAGCDEHLGLRIAYASGYEDAFASAARTGRSDPSSAFADASDAEVIATLCASAPADVLLTSEWPAGVTYGSEVPANLPEAGKKGSQIAAACAEAAQPRYHFAATCGVHFARAPYVRRLGGGVTRFTALGSQGKEATGGKSLMALRIRRREPPGPAPQGTTASPYIAARAERAAAAAAAAAPKNNRKRARPGNVNSNNNNNTNTHAVAHVPGQLSGQPLRMVPGAPVVAAAPPGAVQLKVVGSDAAAKPCWFCLSSPDVEKHLVVAVGDNVYLAAPKGPLHNLHCIVLPITHHTGAALALPAEVEAEINVFKKRLSALYEAESLAPVFYERCVGAGHHMHIQAVPVAKGAVSGLRQALRDQGSKVGITFRDGPAEEEGSGPQPPPQFGFLTFELPDGKPPLVHAVPRGKRHPMQFARTALATAMGEPGRADWKKCAEGKERETELAREFRAKLAKFKHAG